MIYTDHHVHTYYSPDSKADIKEYIRIAKEKNQDFVMFTDHMDFGGTDPEFQEGIDYKKYFKQMKEIEEEMEFKIRIGVEIGYEKNYRSQIEDFLSRYPFDYVIASIHYGDGFDFYLGDFFHGKTQYESYLRYFEIQQEMVENFVNYDVLGHLDFIVRYGPFDDKNYDFETFKPIIDAIMLKAINEGKGIEINTSGLREPNDTFYPKNQVIERYKNLGGRILTIGSDSHFNQQYGSGILKAVDFLKTIGVNEISTFSQRKEDRIKL